MLNASQRRFAEAIARIIECNPFLPDRIDLERDALGKDFVEHNADWNLHPHAHTQTENLDRLQQRARDLLQELQGVDLKEQPPCEQHLYLDLVSFVLFDDFRSEFESIELRHGKRASQVYKRFLTAWEKLLPAERTPAAITARAPHWFAVLFQMRRAFNNIFRHLIGSSSVIIDLRADVWRSIFTLDIRQYTSTMFCAMRDFPTLITGPTGSGKELVARAVGLSGYAPFDPEAGTFSTLQGRFASLNLSAISPQLIESALFGHAKGAFTGATEHRMGWLEKCPVGGAVFLDEIGELDEEIQVKLLRVVQDRIFYRLGEVEPRRFEGRIIAATNRDLAVAMRSGCFRSDFYYRLCADRLETPSLAVRVQANPQELPVLVEHLMCRVTQPQEHLANDSGDTDDTHPNDPHPEDRDDPEAADASEADSLAKQCTAWIEEHLGIDYEWPGNVRELDQCIRSWLIRRHYQPSHASSLENDEMVTRGKSLEDALEDAALSADELLSLYCRVMYARTGSYLQTAKLLGLDRRTVKARIESGAS